MKITVKQLKQLIRESIEEMRRDNPLHRVRLDLGADIRKEVELKSLTDGDRVALANALAVLDKLSFEDARMAKNMIDRILS